MRPQEVAAPSIPDGFDPYLTQVALGCTSAPGSVPSGEGTALIRGCHLSTAEVAAIEAVLHYKFTNLEVLSEALTHASVQFKKSYQRLEFLGDAVLDLVVVTKAFDRRNASPW